MFNKNLIFLIINFHLCFSEVIIIPNEDIVIKEGDPIEITCTSFEKVDFFFPRDLSGLSDTSYSYTIKPSNGAIKYTFERSRSVFGDTGWYGCVESSKNKRKLNEREILVTPDTYDEIEIKWVYVYVKSEEHPFTIDVEDYQIRGTVGQELILPCRVTSPDYKVTFSAISEMYSPTEPFESRIYDPKRGFIIPEIKEIFQGGYICKIKNRPDKLIAFHVTIEHASPTSSALGIYTETFQQMTVGKQFSMVCGIIQEWNYGIEQLVWKTPEKSHSVVKSEQTEFKNLYHYTNKLTIENVTEDDVGEYKCHFYGSGDIKTAKVDLQLHKREYMDAAYIGRRNNVARQELGSNFTQILRLSGYPFPTFKWLDQNGTSLENDWTPVYHGVNGENMDILIKKNQLTFGDQGKYQLWFYNSSGQFGHEIFIEVVEVETLYVSKNDKVKADCQVKNVEENSTSYISWDYTHNFENLTGNSSLTSDYEITSIVINNTRISTIEVFATRTGKLICHECIDEICNSTVKIIDIPVSMEFPRKSPKILDQISINEGEPITIDCQSSEATEFLFPKSDQLLKTSEETITQKSGNSVRFERRRAVYGDTGWYACGNFPEKYEKMKKQFLITPEIYDEENVQWVYVFVKSNQHLFVDTPHVYQDNHGVYHLFEKVGNDVVLPCRPTSEEYQVKLFSGHRIIDAEYDPTKGITIQNVQKNGPLHYFCLAVDKNQNTQERRDFKIDLLDNSYEKPKIYSNVLSHMEVGKSFEMDCKIKIRDRTNYFIDWMVPETDLINKSLITLSNFSYPDPALDFSVVSLKLSFKDVTPEDFGVYECRFYKYSSVRSDSVYLKPHDEKKLTISVQNEQNEYVVDRNKIFKWKIDVDAYPIPEWHWFNPRGQGTIIFSNIINHDVNSERFTIEFTKLGFTTDDLGTHKIVVMSPVQNITIPITIIVDTSPKIMELHLKTFADGDVFVCRAKGSPVPSISWEHLTADQTMKTTSPEYIDIVETNSSRFEATSFAKIKIQWTGFVACKAANEINQDYKLEPVTTHTLGNWTETINVTQGRNATMKCNVLIDNLISDISWYNGGTSLKNEGRLNLNESVTKVWILSQLTIENVKKSDEGNYTCIGTIKNGSEAENSYRLYVSASAAISTSVILQFSIIIVLLFYFM